MQPTVDGLAQGFLAQLIHGENAEPKHLDASLSVICLLLKRLA